MNDVTPLRPSISSSPQASALAMEVAKILKLVAPVSMDDTAQVAWIATAVDALEDIRASEVAAISAELRRTITRHNQIVPAIAEKVAEHRKRSKFTGSGSDVCRCGKGTGPFSGRTDIHWVRDGSGTLMIETCDPSIGERVK